MGLNWTASNLRYDHHQHDHHQHDIVYNIYYNMEPGYWGGPGPPCWIIGGGGGGGGGVNGPPAPPPVATPLNEIFDMILRSSTHQKQLQNKKV